MSSQEGKDKAERATRNLLKHNRSRTGKPPKHTRKVSSHLFLKTKEARQKKKQKAVNL